MPGLFSQHLLLCPLTVTVCSRWMPGIYENKLQDSFPNVYCYVPWQSQFVLDGCLAFMKINNRTLFAMSTSMSIDSRSLFSIEACVYSNTHQDSFPNVYCYVPWELQFVLDGCLAFMEINTKTLFPTSTAMSIDSRSLFSMDAWSLWRSTPGLFSQCLLLYPLIVVVCSRWMPGVYENKHLDSFPNVYCYVPWQSQFVFDRCLALWK